MGMDKRERLQATLAGAPVDRLAVALWRHFPVDDQTPEGLAAATIDWQQRYDFDFVKVTPSSSFCLKDWGARDEWRGNPEGTRDYTGRVVERPEDWSRLKPLDPRQECLGDQLQALRLIRQGLGGETPVIQTIFSPLSQARNLVGADHLAVQARENRQALSAALDVITDTTVRFVEAARDTGIDGIFYAVQLATTQVFSLDEYRQLGEPYDRRILAAADGLWLNVVHLHGEHILFDLAAGYPAAVMNWHDTETPPTLAEGKRKFPGAVCGGLRQWQTMVCGTPEQVRAEARRALELSSGERLILGTGCVTPIVAPRANLLAARQAAEELYRAA
jgi:uroporphyrinogen decarboxylase